MSKLSKLLTASETKQVIDVFELYSSPSKACDLANYCLNQKGSTLKVTYRGMRSFLLEVAPASWQKYLDLQKKRAEVRNQPLEVIRELGKEPDKEETKKPREGPYPPFTDENGWLKEDSDNPFQRKSRLKKFNEMFEARADEAIFPPDEETC